jgi:membrane-associated protease RseP (regulator of RpoE activity)
MQDSKDNYNYGINEEIRINVKKSNKKRFSFLINILLFLLTFFTTTLAGAGWLNIDPYNLENFRYGLTYSILILTVITAHEFGHYIAARIHKVDVTLPYYIPFPFLFLNPFGTMGAVIKMRTRTQSRKSLFDIGSAGPIAGWIVSLAFLIIGFAALPPLDYLFKIHPEYTQTGIPTTGLTFGNNLLFIILNKIFSSASGSFIPPMNEIYHYPFLCVGWFGLLITALNMMPVGQLDGGHISYAMFGDKSKYIGYAVFYLLIFFGLLGLLPFLGINFEIGSVNWLVWAVLIFFVIKIKHPPICSDMNTELNLSRKITGWFTFFIFIISFCPVPITEL